MAILPSLITRACALCGQPVTACAMPECEQGAQVHLATRKHGCEPSRRARTYAVPERPRSATLAGAR